MSGSSRQLTLKTWRSAMRAASQLPGKGPTDVDDAPCTCTLIKNLIMMMIYVWVGSISYTVLV